MESKTLFRCYWKNTNLYAEFVSEQQIEVLFYELPVIKETDKCYWVLHNEKRHLVLKDQTGKRYAYETKQRALKAFITKRKSYGRRLRNLVSCNNRLMEICFKLKSQ